MACKPENVIWAFAVFAALNALQICRLQRWACWLSKAVIESAAYPVRTGRRAALAALGY